MSEGRCKLGAVCTVKFLPFIVPMMVDRSQKVRAGQLKHSGAWPFPDCHTRKARPVQRSRERFTYNISLPHGYSVGGSHTEPSPKRSERYLNSSGTTHDQLDCPVELTRGLLPSRRSGSYQRLSAVTLSTATDSVGTQAQCVWSVHLRESPGYNHACFSI